MKYKQFDVVVLKNKYNATILGIENNKYKVEVVDEKGNRVDIKLITDNEIEDILLKK